MQELTDGQCGLENIFTCTIIIIDLSIKITASENSKSWQINKKNTNYSLRPIILNKTVEFN